MDTLLTIDLKILFWVMNHQYFICRKYAFQNLKEYFEQKNHLFEIVHNNKFKHKNKHINQKSLGLKLPLNQYDLLIFVNQKDQFDLNPTQTRDLINYFLQRDKPVICIKGCSSLEYFNFGPKIHYALPAKYFYLHNFKKLFLKPHYQTFPCPIITISPHLQKKNCLTKQEFYQKYHLNPENQLILFLPGVFHKLERISRFGYHHPKMGKMAKRIDLFFKHLWKIKTTLEAQGYHLITKQHNKKNYSRNVKFTGQTRLAHSSKYDQITQIQQQDYYECLQYSTHAFTIASTVVYELSAQKIPTFEFGQPNYFLRWSGGKSGKYQTNLDYEKMYDSGRDLIYGYVATDQDFKSFDHLMKAITNFLDTDYSKQSFQYERNHPFFGDTYQQNLDDFYQIIISYLSKHQLIKETN